LNLDKKINTLEDAMGVIVKLKNGITNILSENRQHEAEIADLKYKIEELTKEKVRIFTHQKFRTKFSQPCATKNNLLTTICQHSSELSTN
jgi:predicted phosphatase